MGREIHCEIVIGWIMRRELDGDLEHVLRKERHRGREA